MPQEIFKYGSIVSRMRFVVTSLGVQYLYPQLFTDYSDKLGTPLVDKLTIADSLANPTVKLELDTVLIDVTESNVIKETPVQGRKGKVKEYISEDDSEVIIRGAVFSEDKDAYPTAQIQALKALKQIAQVEVTSDYLAALDITTLVIKKLRLPQRAGKASVQSFEMRCVSEIPYELEITEDV